MQGNSKSIPASPSWARTALARRLVAAAWEKREGRPQAGSCRLLWESHQPLEHREPRAEVSILPAGQMSHQNPESPLGLSLLTPPSTLSSTKFYLQRLFQSFYLSASTVKAARATIISCFNDSQPPSGLATSTLAIFPIFFINIHDLVQLRARHTAAAQGRCTPVRKGLLVPPPPSPVGQRGLEAGVFQTPS